MNYSPRHVRPAFVGASAAAFLAACSPEPSSVPAGTSPGQSIRMEQFCDAPGLDKPLRETYILIDSAKLKRAESPEQFAQLNVDARSAVLAIGDPASSVDQGISAARERVTLLLTSPDGAAPRQLFTGCLPALSIDDREAIAKSESAAATFFTGGKEQAIREAADQFRTALIGSLIATARAQPESGASSSDAFLKSISSSAVAFGGKAESVPRLVFVTDSFAAAASESIVDARRLGFAKAEELTVKLGFGDVAIVGSGSESEVAREGTRSLLLGMGGNLVSWTRDGGSMKSNSIPTELRRFSGVVTYPVSPVIEESVQIRLGLDANGRLTNSWMIAIGDRTSGVPMDGGGACTADGACELRSETSGMFAQLWVPERQGNEPYFDNQTFPPYGALRQWRIDIRGETLTGAIFDPAVDQIGTDPRVKELMISATLQPNANF